MPTVADHIAKFLHEKGVTHAFGIIGAGNVALFDAIARLGKTEIVCVHHESAAAMAATAWSRIRGRAGVAIVTTGAGSANAITGCLAAQMDSVPLLVISGNEPSRYLEMEPLRVVGVQGFHSARVAQHVAKGAWRCTSAGVNHRHATMAEAYTEATTGRPGPVWIDFGRDLFNVPA
jgi:acetolactate synthase-1/2/3 large subunit